NLPFIRLCPDKICTYVPMTSPPEVHFGTSSWAYEGWQGLVYQRTHPKSRFSADTLAEYTSYVVEGRPWFKTVGIDHSFYRPAGANQLAHYADQVLEDFRFCSKVWEELTIPTYASMPAMVPRPGKPIHASWMSACFSNSCSRRRKKGSDPSSGISS